MFDLLFAASRGVLAYLNFSLFQDRTQDLVAHLAIGGLLALVVIMIVHSILVFLRKNWPGLLAVALVVVGLMYAHNAEASELGAALTKSLEGYSSSVYKDTLGVDTIGYGFNCETAPCKKSMTRAEADAIFTLKYEEARERAKRFTGNIFETLPENWQDVLTDMSYNLGNRLFEFSKFRTAVKNRNLQGMISEMRSSAWYGQTGKRPEILVKWLLTNAQ